MATRKVDKGTTVRLWAQFNDAAGAGETGLSAVIRIARMSDDNFWSGSAWGASPSDPAMTEYDSSNLPGLYYYDFSVPSDEDEFTVRADGTASATNRYATGLLISDITADAAMGNYTRQTIATSVVRVYDHDNTTLIGTLTPGVDSTSQPTERRITPT